jgi:hypothetical protein
MTSSNGWTSSWLSSIWTLTTFDWLILCGVSWWMVESVIGSLYTIGFATFWSCSLTSPLYTTFMFGAFIGSSPIGFTCYSSCSCACSWTCWCLTYFSCFLRLLVTILDFFWNQQVLGKPLHCFWTIDFNFFIEWPLSAIRSLYETSFINWVPIYL